MLITGLDTETTGLSPEKGDRIIEVCLSVYDFTTRTKKVCFKQRIHPGSKSIHPDAQRVHGISMEDLVGCPTFDKVAPKICAILERSDWAIAHNLDFDAPFLQHELSACGLSLPAKLKGYCTMENGRWACPDGKLPRLQELCGSLGVEYDPSKAHAAEYDVDVMMQSLFIGLDLGFFRLESA